MDGLIGAGFISLMLLFGSGLLKNLPQSTLAAVVMAAAISLADIKAMKRLWKQRPIEFFLAMAALLGVAVFGVLEGIVRAIVLSIVNIFRRASWPYQATLGKVSGISGHHDTTQYPEAQKLDGAVIYRFDAPLFFANARSFKEQIRKFANSQPKPNWIIVASEPITDVDTTAADMLLELDEELNAKDIYLVFAEMKNPVRLKVERYELIGPLNPEHFFPTIDEAVATYTENTGKTWV